MITYALLIIGFTFFYTAVQINPVQMAEDLKKYGGFIPGIRPGKRTAEYINDTLTRITLPGALFLASIAVISDYFADAAWYWNIDSRCLNFDCCRRCIRHNVSNRVLFNHETL